MQFLPVQHKSKYNVWLNKGVNSTDNWKLARRFYVVKHGKETQGPKLQAKTTRSNLVILVGKAHHLWASLSQTYCRLMKHFF